jgi:hypothetical protein
MTTYQVSGRAPLYMGLITLSTAMATVTAIWLGALAFGLSALVLEAVIHTLNQMN